MTDLLVEIQSADPEKPITKIHNANPKKSKSKRKVLSNNNAPDTVSNTKESKIKPIIKNAISTDDGADSCDDMIEKFSYRKKRNKSVSFLLDDTNEEVVSKKSKSNNGKLNTNSKGENEVIEDKKKQKKSKKDVDEVEPIKKKKEKMRSRVFRNTERYEAVSKPDNMPPVDNLPSVTPNEDIPIAETEEIEKRKKKNKKRKKQNSVSETFETDGDKNETADTKKLLPKADGDGIPQKKKAKKEAIPTETIAEDLQTLKIGDNPHSLTDLLDDMTVSDKSKQKKQHKEIKKKQKEAKEKTAKTDSGNSENNSPGEQVAEKEKTKWKKRKWNKGRPSAIDDNWLTTTVIVENLPLTTMLTYKELLKEKFASVGAIKNIGIAELYPTMVSKPVFTTTVQFENEDAATKALEEDNTLLEKSRIRVQRPLSSTLTTVVVRSYAELNDQNLSSIFNGAGKIRNIRLLDKSPANRKRMAVAFVEFDGPESQEKALELAQDIKIGAKKIHVSKFENRAKKTDQKQISAENNADNEM